jgi:replication-associated recombination protein RarA
LNDRRAWSEQTTPGGYAADEASSSIQKAIRRSDERRALHFVAELERGGYGAFLWRRLALIASEDIGPANPGAAIAVAALRSSWEADRKAKGSNGPMFLVHATLLLCRSAKSRVVDDAFVWAWEAERPPLEVADEALDRHTARGRRMGRGWQHFYDSAARLEQPTASPPDYEAAARDARTRRRR